MQNRNHGMWRHKRVFVTGATGLLGAWLTDWLVQQQADVICLIRDHVPDSNFYRLGLHERAATVRGGIEDYDLLERVLNEYEIEVAFHLAAQTLVGIANRNPRSTFSANVTGTWNLLDASRRAPWVKAIVLASSDKAYGAQASLPYREGAPLVGSHPYDVSKSCADLIGQMYWHSYRLPVGITRCGNFYGGGDLNFNRIVPGTIRSILNGERPVIRSDGTLIRDYFYIKDAVSAYVTLAEALLEGKAVGQAYNFSNEQQITVVDLVHLISRLMNRSDLEPVLLNTAKNEIVHQYLSAEKSRGELGWKSSYSLDQGLQETITWYQDFFADKKSKLVLRKST